MDNLGIILLLTTILSVVQYHYFKKIPTVIGVTFCAMFVSLICILLKSLGFVFLSDYAKVLIASINFNQTVLNYMIGPLLFAGAIHIELDQLKNKKLIIATFATVGVLLSSFLVSILMKPLFDYAVFGMPFSYILLFGILISPTDPIAVLSILKKAEAPKSLNAKIVGESLFNDGVGIVFYAIVLDTIIGAHHISINNVVLHLAREAGGGVILGLALGYLTYLLIKNINNYSLEILITITLVFFGYFVAEKLHTSGPIIAVVSGLFIGNKGKIFDNVMSEKTREQLFSFWEIVDELLNILLFVFIGLEILAIDLQLKNVLIGIVGYFVVLLARFFTVSATVKTLEIFKQNFSSGAIRIMTWGGLRGAISIALALSLPPGEFKDVILTITYVVVTMSIFLQGLTVGPLVRYIVSKNSEQLLN
jgi:CPA1 family monovalent cation:H+ antiporter